MKKILSLGIMLILTIAINAESIITIAPVKIGTKVDIDSEDCGSLTLNLEGTVAPKGLNFDLYIPEALNFNPSYMYKGELLPYTKNKKTGEITYNHSITVSLSNNQDKVGFKRYLVVIKDEANNSSFTSASGELMSFDLGTGTTEGLFNIFTNNQAIFETSDNKLGGATVVSSFVEIGSPATKSIAFEGIVPAIVTKDIPAGAKVDIEKVTKIEGTSTNSVEASYSRTLPSGSEWATVCLPFAATPDKNTTLYSVDAIGSDALDVTQVSTLAAGTPALAKASEAGGTISFSGTGAINTTITNNALTGTFEPITVTEDGTYYIKANKFWAINGNFKVGAFKAYLGAGKKASKSDVLDINIDETTAIKAVNGQDGIEEVYGVNGVRQNNLKSGLNIVKIGDKVMKVIVK